MGYSFLHACSSCRFARQGRKSRTDQQTVQSGLNLHPLVNRGKEISPTRATPTQPVAGVISALVCSFRNILSLFREHFPSPEPSSFREPRA